MAELKNGFFDFDLTLVTGKNTLIPGNEYWLSLGELVVTVASGRSAMDIEPTLAAIPELDRQVGIVAVENGGVAYRRQKGRRPDVLYRIEFEEDTLRHALEVVQSERFDSILFTPELLAERAHLCFQDEQAAQDADRTALPGTIVSALPDHKMSEIIRQASPSMLTVQSPKSPRSLAAKLKEVAGIKVYDYDHSMQVIPEASGKDAAVRFITESTGIDPAESMAAGDSINDWPMVGYPGLAKRAYLGDIVPPQLQGLNITHLPDPSKLGPFIYSCLRP